MALPHMPKVSVIMPVFNAERFLREATESILKQTFTDFEFIINDDGSTDRSWAVIQEYARQDARIVAIQNPENIRISRTLNRCLEQARGTYIARMDADDVSALDRLQLQVAYMEAHPEVGVSGGTMKLIDAKGKIIGQRRYYQEDREIRKHIFRFSPFSHPTIIFRKTVLDASGYYDPQFDFAEDYELYFRIGQHAHFGNLRETTLYYRVLPQSITTSRTKVMEMKTLAIRKRAERDYGYRMSLADRMYWVLQYFSILLIPYPVKIWIFNKLAGWR